jgi:hypothetical protein
MENPWQFAGSSREGEVFDICGANVCDQGWQVVPGEEAHVTDPVYGQSYSFKIFSIQDDEETFQFAAGEFSKEEWGFYTRE